MKYVNEFATRLVSEYSILALIAPLAKRDRFKAMADFVVSS
jgi:hypothetical protein